MTDPHPATLPVLPLAAVEGVGISIWSSQAPPPTSGQTCSDSHDWDHAQVITIDKRKADGTDVSAGLAQLRAGDNLRLEHALDPSRYAYYGVSGTPSQVGDAFQYPVVYKSGNGRVPASGTQIKVTLLLNPPDTLALNWLIEPAREPSRFWIVCYCGHGEVVESVATFPGAPPVIPTVVGTTAQNLIRKTGCECHIITPPLGP